MSRSPSPLESRSPGVGPRGFLVSLGALLGGGVALADLVFFRFGGERLLLAGSIDRMGPITALSILLLGLAFLMWHWAGPGSPRALGAVIRGIGGVLVAVVLALALRRLIDPSLGARWISELAGVIEPTNWNLHAAMTPSEALLLVLTAIGLLGMLRPASAKPYLQWVATGSSLLALSLAVFDGAFAAATLTTGIGSAVWGWSGALADASVLSLNLSTLGALGIWGSALGAISGGVNESAASGRRSRAILAALGILAICIFGAGIALLRSDVLRKETDIYSRLSSITKLKVEVVDAWLKERWDDAAAMKGSSRVATYLHALGSGPGDIGEGRRLSAYLEKTRASYNYEAIVVYDGASRPVAGTPATEIGAFPLPASIAAACRSSGEVVLEDLHPGGDGLIHMDLVVPVPGSPGSPLEGFVDLRIDAARDLFPLVARWPLSSRSGESVLLRRDGSTITYLSGMRFLHGMEAKLHIPVGRTSLLATQVASHNAMDIVKGRDYRGVPVLGVYDGVKGAPWLLLTKIDVAEAMEPASVEARQLAAVFILMLVVVGLGVVLAGRQRRVLLLTQSLDAAHARDQMAQKLGFVMRHANDGILLFDDRTVIIEANERAEAMYGSRKGGLIGVDMADLRPPSAEAEAQAQFETLMVVDGLVFETMHQRRNGTVFPVEVSSRHIEVSGESHLLSIVRDITERRFQQREIERLGRMFRVVSHVNQAIVHARERSSLFAEVCRILNEVGHFKIVWIGWIDPATRQLVPAAASGDDRGYVAEVRVSADPESPRGRGPAGTAFREGRTCVSNDFLNDPATGPWKDSARECGIRAIIVIPLREGGEVRGILTAYSDETNFFDTQKITIMEGAAGDISFGLDVLEGEKRRREAEAAVRNSEERLAFLLSATPAVIYSLRAPGNPEVQFISSNLKAVLGYDPAQFTAKTGFWESHVHPEDRDRASGAFARVAADGSAACEYRFRHADGRYRWMRDEMRVVRDAGGSPVEFVGYWLDISEGRALAERLEREQARFRFIFEHAPVGISLDSSGKGIIVNSEHCRITGVPLDQANVPGVYARASHPDDYEKQMKAAEGYIRGEAEQYSIEKRYIHANGNVVWAQLTSRFYIDPTTREKRSVTILSDITERRAVEEALHNRETIFSSIIGPAVDSIVLIDVETGRFIEFNEAAYRNLGYSLEEFSRMTIFDIEAKDSPENIRRAFALMGRPEGAVIEGRHRNKAGGTQDVRVSARSITLGGRRYITAIWSDMTERKRAEAVVRESEQRYRELFDLESDTIFLIDRESGRILQANLAGVAMYGHTVEELLELTVEDLSAEPERTRAARLAPGHAADVVTIAHRLHRRRDGTVFPVEISVRFFERAGRRCSLAAIRDITERERTVAEVRRSRDRLAKAEEIAQLGNWELDIPTGKLNWSEETYRIFETTPAGFTATLETFMEAVHPEDRSRVLDVYTDSVAGRKPFFTEHRILLAGGRVKHVEESGETIYAANGTPERSIGSIQDVTRRKLAELELQRFNVELEAKIALRTRELAEGNSEMQALLNAVPDMVMQVRKDGTVLKCRRAHDSSGLSGVHCPGSGGDDEPADEAIMRPCMEVGRKALESGQMENAEATMALKGGSLSLEFRAAPVTQSEFVIFIRDITERKRREAETAVMLGREHEISEMKTRFISVTSHEFRTPMAAVMGSAELLRNHMDRLDETKRNELFERISSSVRRMTEMLDEILTLNRIDMGKTGVLLAAVNLGQAAEGMIEEARIGDRERHRFEFAAEGDAAHVVTDLAIFQHIFSNLLSNAVRYSPEGTVVTVRLRAGDGGLVLTVADQGIGIPEADRSRIFEPFERASNVGSVKGTGLGLNIVKRMTELLGGRISVDSELARGSRFTLELPVARAKSP